MNRILLAIVIPLVMLANMQPVMHAFLVSQPSSANAPPAGPFESVLSSLLSSVLGFMPWLALLAVVLFALVYAYGESPFAQHEPLVPTPPATRDLAALRSMLRRVRAWLARQQLPATATPLAESIGLLCEEIDRQLAGREPRRARAHHDLATQGARHRALDTRSALSTSAQRAYRLFPSLNTTANDMLLNGLRAVDAQLGRVHENIARVDIRQLEVQARYLELKSESEAGPGATVSPHPALLATSAAPPFDLNLDVKDVGHTLVFAPDRAGRSARAPAPPQPRVIASPTTGHEADREQDDNANISLLALGAAAVAVVALEESRDGSAWERTDDRSGGSGFGGAGASGDWTSLSEGDGNTESIATNGSSELSNSSMDSEDVSPSAEPAEADDPDISAANPDT